MVLSFRRITTALALAGVLVAGTGCAALQEKYQTVVSAIGSVSTATVSPTAVIIAANAFDGIKVTATNYLTRPRCNGANGPVCRSPAATKVIVPAIRSGTIARDQLEQFLRDHPGQLGPTGAYDALNASIGTLKGVLAQYQ